MSEAGRRNAPNAHADSFPAARGFDEDEPAVVTSALPECVGHQANLRMPGSQQHLPTHTRYLAVDYFDDPVCHRTLGMDLRRRDRAPPRHPSLLRTTRVALAALAIPIEALVTMESAGKGTQCFMTPGYSKCESSVSRPFGAVARPIRAIGHCDRKPWKRGKYSWSTTWRVLDYPAAEGKSRHRASPVPLVAMCGVVDDDGDDDDGGGDDDCDGDDGDGDDDEEEVELALGTGAGAGSSWQALSCTSRRWTGNEEDEEEGCHIRRLSLPFLEEPS